MVEKSDNIVRFDVGGTKFATLKKTFPQGTLFYSWFCSFTQKIPFCQEDHGVYFVDRDPFSFGVILNYFRLRHSNQLWEACLPKDPDRLAMLTQEAEYFRLEQLREQAICLLQSCSDKSDTAYVNEVLSKSASCPQGFKHILSS
ncbi:hypothetical protein PFISCL1PPCAC_27484, partial [Pristionchus fissidentatus]